MFLITVSIILPGIFLQKSQAQFVFSDHFNRAALSPGGTPSMTYTTATTGAGSFSMASNSFLQILNGPNASSGNAGRSYATGLLSTYASPFNTVLSSNTGIITWTFNVQTSKSSTADGFQAGKYGIATVLVSNSANLIASGTKGYAVVYGGQGVNFIKNYRLVKFNNGLAGDANLTNVISSGADNFSGNQDYISIRVTYNPSNNSWSLYLRDDNGAWQDPSSGVNTLVGTATDNTYTSLAMTHFGFFYNHGSSSGVTCQFDNFDVNLPVSSPTLYVNPSSLLFTNQPVGTNSASQSFNLSGLGLTGSPGVINVTAPSQFQVSNNNNTWGTTTSIAYSSATLTQTPVYVRFSPTIPGCSITGNITFSGGGVLSAPTVSLTGVSNTVVITNPAPVCAPATVNLTAAAITTGSTAGLTFTYWTNAAATTPLASPNAVSVSGTYYIKGTNTVGGCSDIKAVVVTIYQPSGAPTGAIATPAAICNSGSITLTQTGGILGTGATWHWYTDAAFSVPAGTSLAANASLTVSPTVTTTYYIRAEGGTAPCSTGNTLSANVTVTVNKLSVAPTAAIASPAVICNGGSTILTETGGILGTGAVWHWYTDASFTAPAGTSTATDATLTVSPVITTTYYVRAEGGTAPCAVFNTLSANITVNVNATGTWFGFSDDWNEPSNWCGGTPTALTDVYIPVVSPGLFYPASCSPGTAKANNIMIVAGASIIVNNYKLQVSGNISNAGIFSAANGCIEMNGNTVQAIIANTFQNNAIKNLVISNSSTEGVKLGGNIDIYQSLTYTGNGRKFNTSGYLTLKSTITETAWVGDLTGNNISGEVTVERYIATGTSTVTDHAKSWQLLAVPTTGQTIKAAWQEDALTANGNPNPGFGTMLTSNVPNAATQPDPGFDVYTYAGPSIKIYNYATNAYDGPASTNLPVYNQKGYFILVRGDRSVTAFNQAPTATVLRTKGVLFTAENPPPTTAVNLNKFESIGNPYASAIDLRSITKTGGVDEFYYVWDPRLGGSNSLGAFQTLYKAGNDYYAVPGGGSYGAGVNNFIQSGQAFLVHASVTNGTVGFSESAKADQSKLVQRPNGQESQQHFLRTDLFIINANGSAALADGVLNLFGDDYSNDVNSMDAVKTTNTAENLSINNQGHFLSLERKHTINSADTIFLNLSGERISSYRFKFTSSYLSNRGLQGFLEDNYLHTSTALNMDSLTAVDFNIENIPASYAADRFRIVFRPSVVVPVTFTSVKAYRNLNNINVEWSVNNETSIKQYVVEKSGDGFRFNTLATTRATGNNGASAVYHSSDDRPLNGNNYYRIRSIDMDGRIQSTEIVKVIFHNISSALNVYPNPVTNGSIHLQFINEPAGTYYIKLMNMPGEAIISKRINHAEGSSTEIITWDHKIANGIYTLEVTQPDGTKKNIKVFY